MVDDRFVLLPYTSQYLMLTRRLADIGCAAVIGCDAVPGRPLPGRRKPRPPVNRYVAECVPWANLNCEALNCTQDCAGGGGCCASDGPSPAARGAVPIAATAASAPNMGAMCFRPIPIIDPSWYKLVSARSRSASRRGGDPYG